MTRKMRKARELEPLLGEVEIADLPESRRDFIEATKQDGRVELGRSERGLFALLWPDDDEYNNPLLIWAEWEDPTMGGFVLGYTYKAHTCPEDPADFRIPLKIEGDTVWVVRSPKAGVVSVVPTPLSEFRHWLRSATKVTYLVPGVGCFDGLD